MEKILISTYKGEGRILIIPAIKHISGLYIESDWFVNISDVKDSASVGRAITCAVDFAKHSAVSTLTHNEIDAIKTREKNTKY